MYRQLRRIFAMGALLLCASSSIGAERAPRRALTVADTIEATRPVGFISSQIDPTSEAVQLSPDGTRYLATVMRGDLVRNGNWVEFLWGSTEPGQVKQAPRVAARLFTADYRTNSLRTSRIRWVDERDTIAFVWSDGLVAAHVLTLKLSTGELIPRTRHASDVTTFDVSRGGASIIFSALAPAADRSHEMRRNGFAVSDQTLLFDIVQGRVDGLAPRWRPQVYVDGGAGARLVTLSSRSTAQEMRLHLAPDGRQAIVLAPPRELPLQWDRYSDTYFQAQLAGTRNNPAEPTELLQYYVVDVASAAARPLWNAPTAFAASGRLVWSADSRHILVGPTFLPVESAGSTGLAGMAIAHVDVATGQFSEVAASPAVLADGGFSPSDWRKDGIVELTPGRSGQRRYARLSKVADGWRLSSEPAASVRKRREARVQIELDEAPESPPALFARDTRTGSKHLLLDLNARFRTDVALGRVQVFRWTAANGYSWTGKLFYPVGYDQQRRVPLVIQLAALVRTGKFSLAGDELVTTAFAAQPLANRGIAVLQMGAPDNEAFWRSIATPEEYASVLAGIDAAIDALAGAGIANPTKVGLVGFSRTGGWVEYAITHSLRRYAAAIVADNQNSSYLQYLTLPTSVRAEYERTNGAAPIGDGLQAWIQRAPGFNADKVHTPLRMEVDRHGAFGILQAWELFSQLRHLNKPVELYVAPESTEAAHPLERPAQILASAQGTVDWMDFWLNDREDEAATKRDQYARWNRLRRLHEHDSPAQPSVPGVPRARASRKAAVQ